MILVHLRINYPSFHYPSLEALDVSDFNIPSGSMYIFPVDSYLSSHFRFSDTDSCIWPLDPNRQQRSECAAKAWWAHNA